MGRAPCRNKDELKKGPWLPEEDRKLIDFIEKHGPGNWRDLPKKAALQRCGKSCRLRWTNYLRPDIKRGRFTFEEEEAIIQLHSIVGNKWSSIAAKLPGRTDNEVKNFWNTHIKKRLLQSGIDPMTHRHRFDLLNQLPFILNSPFQNSSYINLLTLLSLQNFVNPDLLKLAATLLSSNPNSNQNMNIFSQEHYYSVTQADHQTHTAFKNTNNIPKCSKMTTIFGNDLNDQWQHNDLKYQNCENNIQYDSNNTSITVDDFLLNAPEFESNKSDNDNNKSSTTCTSQETLLNSNSEFPNNTICSEDEIDSYCRNLMNFDMPLHLFDDE